MTWTFSQKTCERLNDSGNLLQMKSAFGWTTGLEPSTVSLLTSATIGRTLFALLLMPADGGKRAKPSLLKKGEQKEKRRH